ncbi:MAG: hypothetical protein VB050_08150 [Geobacteraceae bacterium]|nr:hypothetical protein [Geobacteraceae bacterium]
MTHAQQDEAFRKINQLILNRGSRMSKAQLDKAMNVWEVLMKSQCDRVGTTLSKSEGSRPVVRAVEGGGVRIARTPTFTRQFSPYTDPATGAPWSGHQLAAIRAGLDPHTPGLEKMGYDEMKEATGKQLEESVRPLQIAAGLHLRTD